jgi:hypothetical protein
MVAGRLDHKVPKPHVSFRCSKRWRALSAGQMITSWVCPKQYLALCIKAAFSRYKARVMPASIVERAVPTASLPPFRPFDIIAILAVGISRLPGRTKDALGGVDWTGDYMPGHRGPCQHRKKDCGNANQSEIRHAFLPLVPASQTPKPGCDGRFRSWFLKDN